MHPFPSHIFCLFSNTSKFHVDKLLRVLTANHFQIDKVLKAFYCKPFSAIDWLAACAALVVIAFICIFISTILGCIGLFTHRRFLYVTAGILSIFAGQFFTFNILRIRVIVSWILFLSEAKSS